MALTKITGQVINDTTGLVVGVTTVGGGVSATDGFFSGIVTAVGDASFSGNVSVGGTLTYEDVTNIDSVGLITARNGIVVGSGITLSKDGDIFATGITTISENLKVGTGVTISPDGDGFYTGVVTATSFSGDGSALTGVANTNVIFTDKLSVGDSPELIAVGVGSDLQLSHSGGNSFLTNATGYLLVNSTSGDNVIRSNSNVELQPASGESGAKVIANGAVELYHDNSKKLETSSSGVTVTGTVAATSYTGDGSSLTGVGKATSGTYTSVGTGYYVDITTTSTNIVKYDIMFTGVSIGGGMDWQFQLGDSGGVEGSGYEVVACYRSDNSSPQTENRSDAFRWTGTGSGGFIMDGKFSLTRIHNNKWFGEGQLVRTEAGATLYDMWGTKELSGALTTIRISSSYDDSEVFDGGHFKVIEYTGTV